MVEAGRSSLGNVEGSEKTAMECFVPYSTECDFPLENLPFGVFSTGENPRSRLGVALGECVVDLAAVEKRGLFSGPQLSGRDVFSQETLNGFMECGCEVWSETRETLVRLFSAKEGMVRDDAELQKELLAPMRDVQMHLPARIGDYTDFYACKTHAETVGAMFRGPEHALNPNWVHLPVAYHGRSSSIVVSGTDLQRPTGQWKSRDADHPTYKETEKLDFELEMGLFVGPGNQLGETIDVRDAWKHAFGMVLLNDWSLRDVQLWEGQPLGPFNSKNWATTISPWIVTMEALEPLKCELAKQDPPVLTYLSLDKPETYDVHLEVELLPADTSEPLLIAQSNLNATYWSFPQMIAHHTSTGCNLCPGDLLGTGTLSVNSPSGRGCFLEMTKNGTEPAFWESSTGQSFSRSYLHDGDAVVLEGWGRLDSGQKIGFGECRGKILPRGGS